MGTAMQDTLRFREAETRLWSALDLRPVERFVSLRTGERLRIQELGDGPPVFFVHGATNSGTSWASLLPGLDGFRCLLLDRPGCGLSEPLRTERGSGREIDAVTARADALVADVLDALDIGSAHVVATSFGGYHAFRGAAAHPERFERLVEFSWTVGARIERIPLPLRLAAVPGVRRLMSVLPPTPGAVRSLLKQIGLRRALETGRFTDEMFDVFLALLRDTDTMANELASSPDLVTLFGGLDERLLLSDEVLGAVRSPVLLLWGAEDPMGGESIGRRFTERLPNATFALIDGAGHAPWIDEPDLCAERTSAFLRG